MICSDMTDSFMLILIILLLLRIVAGFLAGLFGIGGGVVMVPVMYLLMQDLGYGDTAMTRAVATSAAVIIPTAVAGTIRNYSGKQITWRPALILGSSGILGTMAGSTLSVLIPSQIHVLVFSGFLICMAGWMIIKQCRYFCVYTLRQSNGILLVLGTGVGVASGMFGIGGGIILIPVLTSVLGMNIHTSVGTSLAAMVLIASGTVLSYIILGWGLTGQVPFSIGYVNILFALILAATSVPAVRIGLKTGAAMSDTKLQILFVTMLVILAARMAVST